MELWEYACSPKKYVAIAAPRFHAKSTAITHAYVLACILFRIKSHVLIVSDTEPQAALFLGDIKRECVENEELKKDFAIKRLTKDNDTETIIEFHDGHQVRILAKGSEQRVRGLKWHGKRPDLIIGDDLENDEMVMNEDRRIKFKTGFTNSILNSGSRNCHVRIVGTILHFDSYLSSLMPEISDPYTRVTPLKIYSTRRKRAWHSIIFRAHPDIDDFSEILWPDMWPEERLRLERQKYEDQGFIEGYSQEYLNNPIDESSAYFRKKDLLAIPDKELDINIREPEEYYTGIDLAISKENRRAWTVFITCGLGSSNILRVRDVIRFRENDGFKIVDEFFHNHAKWKPSLQILEEENIAKSLGGIINAQMHERGVYLNLETIRPIKDKEQRARALQARMRAGGIQFDQTAEWWPILETELIRFPRGEFSDQVDALANICLLLDKLAPAPSREEIAEDEWLLDKYHTYDNDPYNYEEFGRSSITGY